MLSRIDVKVGFILLIVRLSFAYCLIRFAAYESWLNAVCIVTAERLHLVRIRVVSKFILVSLECASSLKIVCISFA